MYRRSSTLIFSVLVMQICSHMTGDEEAILVISLKPPAAMVRMSSSSLSLSLTRFTRLEATRWGRWLMAAVTRSCSL